MSTLLLALSLIGVPAKLTPPAKRKTVKRKSATVESSQGRSKEAT